MRKPPPPLRVYIVVDAKRGSENKKDFWYEVGVAWPHKKGGGAYIRIHRGMSVSGDFVLATPKAAEKNLRDPEGKASFWLSE